jgi:hypothetical protein
MPEPIINALAIRTEPARLWTAGLLQGTVNFFIQCATWAREFSLRFATLLAVVMGPAVLAAYILASWSLAANLGWTGSFPYAAGPLSNWLIWAGIAIAVHVAATVLRRATRAEK